MKPDERELLDRIIAHEEGAFEAFLDRYRSLIYSVLYGKGFAFPRDYIEDVYQALIFAIAKDNYGKLRAFTGRNNCSLATFLQVVTTRFALDELRKWKRHPRGRGMGLDGEDSSIDVEDTTHHGPVHLNVDREQQDIFHNLLFGLEWKRVSVVLWVFRAYTRERIAEVMDTSRANIDALYKRAKDQMTERFAEDEYSRDSREPDQRILTPEVEDRLRRLLVHPTRKLEKALLKPAAKERAVIGLVLIRYPEFHITLEELASLAIKADPLETALSVLDELESALES